MIGEVGGSTANLAAFGEAVPKCLAKTYDYFIVNNMLFRRFYP